MPRFRIAISSKNVEALRDLVRVHGIDVFDHGITGNAKAGYQVGAIVDAAQLSKLKSAGYAVEKLEDVDKVAKLRQRQVGKGDRYAPPGADGPSKRPTEK